MNKIYLVNHCFDVDGGFGDAIPQEEVICGFDNREDANRFLGDNLILGTFLIVNFKNNHRVNLNNRQIRKYTNTFLLRKHTRKIELLKKEYFKNYYSSINQNLIAA